MWPHKPHHYVKVGIPSGGGEVDFLLPSSDLSQSAVRLMRDPAEAMHQICAGHPHCARPVSSSVYRSLIELPSRRQYCLCQSGLSVWRFDVVVFLCTSYGHIFQEKIIQWPTMNGANVVLNFRANCSLSQNTKNHTYVNYSLVSHSCLRTPY
jgi:hypothetical protein